MVYFGNTNIGNVRKSNQDNYLCIDLYDNVKLFTVCDGMGGTKGGNIASEMAIKTFSDYVIEEIKKTENKKHIPSAKKLNFKEVLTIAVEKANTEVYQNAQKNPEFAQMGTTLVSALCFDNSVHTVNVGDSRFYLFDSKSGKVKQVTHDHSYVQALVDIGQLTPEEAAVNPRRNILTMAVGTENTVSPDVLSVKPNAGDIGLLCSDGLYNNYTPSELEETIFSEKEEDDDLLVKIITEKLIDGALKRGGRDNITVITVKF